TAAGARLRQRPRRRPDALPRRGAVRRRPAVRARGEHGQVPRLRGLLGGRQRLPRRPRRLRLRGRVRRGAQVPRDPAVQDRADQQQPGARLPGPARPRHAEELLRMSRYFEDFAVGEVYEHKLGKTVTTADNMWFTLLTMNTN